ncbi:MAG: hypothetical protein WC869_16495 [Phycisphaerae bacterium]|jgi:hypothetical protein
MDAVSQVLIAVLGSASIWLVGRKEHWRRWGYVLGLASQPAWLYTSIHNHQWGIALLSLWYAYAWGQGIWNFWAAKEA